MTTADPALPPAAAAPTTARTARSTAVYTRVAAFGLLLVAFAPLLMVIVGLATGMSLGGDIAFLAPMVVVPLVGAALALRFGTWSKVLGIVLAVLAAFGMFWMAFGLAYPAAFGDFVPGVSFVLGVALTLGGSVAAIVQGRRGNRTSVATRSERRVVVGAGALVGVAAVLSAVLGMTTGSTAAGADGVAVTMSNFEFAESSYQAAAGEPGTLVVHNSDGFVHDIAIPALGVEPIPVLPGSDAVVKLDSPAAGTYPVYCTLHSNTDEADPAEAGMAATLTVR